MSLDVIAEVWEVLKSHIDFNERKDAADSLVNLLIDAGNGAEDIRESFRGDKDIGRALKYYNEQHEVEEEYDDEDYDIDDEW